MVRESPPTRRVLALIEAVADSPLTGQSLAQLAAATGTSKPTALGILNELVAAGWLSRDDVTYRPGAAMVAVGAAARAAFPAVRAARPTLVRLSSDVRAPVTVSVVLDGAVAVVDRVDHAGGSSAFQPGQRYPFAPPSGVMFVAWDTPDELEAWLSAAPLSPLPVDVEGLRHVAAAAREDGYLVVGLGELTAGLYGLLDGVRDDDALARRLGDLLRHTIPAGVQPYLTGPIDTAGSYDVSLVCAPVRDSDGRFDYLVAVLLMRPGVSGAELRRVAAALTEVTAQLTSH